jgi:hypothetical protein
MEHSARCLRTRQGPHHARVAIRLNSVSRILIHGESIRRFYISEDQASAIKSCGDVNSFTHTGRLLHYRSSQSGLLQMRRGAFHGRQRRPHRGNRPDEGFRVSAILCQAAPGAQGCCAGRFRRHASRGGALEQANAGRTRRAGDGPQEPPQRPGTTDLVRKRLYFRLHPRRKPAAAPDRRRL